MSNQKQNRKYDSNYSKVSHQSLTIYIELKQMYKIMKFKIKRLPIIYWTTFLVTLISVSLSVSFSPPERLGFITITHQRNENNQFFKQYLKRNAQMECDVIQQIAIVWNNNYSVQTTVSQQMRNNWKRPIHFFQTDFNSFSFRYKLADQTKAVVYLSIDDDIDIRCEKINKAFQLWKENAVGDIGPLLGFFNAGMIFDIQRQVFKQKPTNYYHQIEMGGAIISRKMIDVYNSYLQQAFQANSIVLKVNNCDDMATNYVAQKYFPQLQKIFIQNIAGYMQVPVKAASSFIDFHKVRRQCNKNFNRIFGQIIQSFSIQKVNLTDKWKMPRKLYQNIIYLVSLPVDYQMILQKIVRQNGIPKEKVNWFVQRIEKNSAMSQQQIKNQSSISYGDALIQNARQVATVLHQQWDNYVLFFAFGSLLTLCLVAVNVLAVYIYKFIKVRS